MPAAAAIIAGTFFLLIPRGADAMNISWGLGAEYRRTTGHYSEYNGSSYYVGRHGFSTIHTWTTVNQLGASAEVTLGWQIRKALSGELGLGLTLFPSGLYGWEMGSYEGSGAMAGGVAAEIPFRIVNWSLDPVGLCFGTGIEYLVEFSLPPGGSTSTDNWAYEDFYDEGFNQGVFDLYLMFGFLIRTGKMSAFTFQYQFMALPFSGWIDVFDNPTFQGAGYNRIRAGMSYGF
jgi:hypothetical protein